MITKRTISLSLIALSVCATVSAGEYKEPEVGFKPHAIPFKEMKVSEYGNHYKMEKSANENDRQIASEESYDQQDEAPKAWNFRTEEKNPK